MLSQKSTSAESRADDATQHSSPEENSARKLLLFALLLAGLVGSVAISNTSFWIDEGGSGLLAIQPTLATWWSTMLWERNSNMQLPLYLLALWAWAKGFGTGEWTLRMLNLPCFVAAIFAVWLMLRQQRERFLFAVLFLCTNAFVWFYLDQARPYMVLLASSMFLLGAVHQFHSERECTASWAWWFTGASLAVGSTSIIGFEWALVTATALWYLGGRSFPLQFAQNFPRAFSTLILGFIAIGVYYLWSLKIGADVPKYGHSGFFMNIAFSVYEFFGFTGLGPNRNALRVSPVSAIIHYALPLSILAVILLAVLIYGRGVRQQARDYIFYGLLILPAPIVILAGEIRDVRVLPRHLTPLLPVIMLLMSDLLRNCWNRKVGGRLLVVAFLITSAVSAMQVRFAARLLRDDYRQAALIARDEMAAGNSVVWSADPQTAMYYGLLQMRDWTAGGFKNLLLPWHDLKALPRNRCIVLNSKPDLYDQKGRIQSLIRSQHLVKQQEFEAFEVWRSAASPSTAR